MIKGFHDSYKVGVDNVGSCDIGPSTSDLDSNDDNVVGPMKNIHHDLLSNSKSDTSGVDEEEEESVLILNELENDSDDKDSATISLLKQIFPEESADNLWKFHLERCVVAAASAANSSTPTDLTYDSITLPHVASDTLTRATENKINNRRLIGKKNVSLPDHFLRLPLDIAVRRCINGTWRYQFISNLSSRVITQHELRYGRPDFASYVTKVVRRDSRCGLGMTLAACGSSMAGTLPLIRVHALSGLGGQSSNVVGPALSAGVNCNDILIGVNGVAFVESAEPNELFLSHVFSRIRSEPDPVVLHLLRRSIQSPKVGAISKIVARVSLLDERIDTSDDDSCHSQAHANVSLQSDLSCSQARSVHFDYSKSTPSNDYRPFVKALMDANIFTSRDEQIKASRMLDDFEFRANQWDQLSAFLIPSSETLLSLLGVRRALSVRIVNMFDDEIDTAYTIWVYDVEAGKEWYSPVRYFRDFEDLRAAILPLCSASIQQIPFPSSKRSALNLFLRSPNRAESNVQRETRCRQLEYFLRTICSMIYKEKIHLWMAEVAIYVQSFLGCDTQEETSRTTTSLQLPQFVDVTSNTTAEQGEKQLLERTRLKREIQCFTYRLFLLDAMSRTVSQFVDRLRTHGPQLKDIEELESQGRDVLKSRALVDLLQIQAFLDKLQNLILDGCGHDFELIAERMEYSSIHSLIRGAENGDSGYWEKLVREAVREQVEVEVYVPLRSVVSRWLVNGWRHEDMEVHFRMKELRCRPSKFFRMVVDDQAVYDWSSVAKILNEGVGLSTLPSVKLRAIVDASREIFRILQPRNEGRRDGHFGADDFLPIFIYCVVHSEVERPCALCVLLRTLCDRMNKMGEIGYYLQTFEAAIKHCEEVDLTDSHHDEEMPSFQSIELDDN